MLRSSDVIKGVFFNNMINNTKKIMVGTIPIITPLENEIIISEELFPIFSQMITSSVVRGIAAITPLKQGTLLANSERMTIINAETATFIQNIISG